MAEESVTATGHGARLAVAFVRVLRGLGLQVPPGSTLHYAHALAAVGLESRARVYWTGTSTLITSPEDLDTYDRAFAAFWLGSPQSEASRVESVEIPIVLQTDEPAAADAAEEENADEARVPALSVRYSPVEMLRHRDFASYTPREHAEARRLMADLRIAGARRRSRRERPTARRRGRPDIRRTVRRSWRTAGEPVERAFREPGEQHRRIVLLLDVSGSMEPYARALARFLHAAVVSRARVEAFAFGTRLTRLTRELRSRDPDAAMSAAAARVVDWSGGTRLGHALREFNDEWGIRGMARGAVVVILSDGWDRGDPELLGEQMSRLARVSYRIVWVNPLKASEGYAPLARGMAAALPYVDEFVEGHSLAALDRLTDAISK